MGVMDHITSADVFVTSCQFSENTMELTYLEHHEQGQGAAIMRSMMIEIGDNPRVRQAFFDLQEMLCDLVDEGYFIIRNPEERPSIREQMLNRRREAADDDED